MHHYTYIYIILYIYIYLSIYIYIKDVSFSPEKYPVHFCRRNTSLFSEIQREIPQGPGSRRPGPNTGAHCAHRLGSTRRTPVERLDKTIGSHRKNGDLTNINGSNMAVSWEYHGIWWDNTSGSIISTFTVLWKPGIMVYVREIIVSEKS